MVAALSSGEGRNPRHAAPYPDGAARNATRRDHVRPAEAGGRTLSKAAGPGPSERTRDETEQPQAHEHGRWHALRASLHTRREKIRTKPTLNATYRILLGTVGAVVLLAGILMIPYPGPGWLVVFAGLGILATEFAWAHHVNSHVLRYYRKWTHWLGKQHVSVKLAVMAGTCAIVLVTVWLLGVFAAVGGWFGIEWTWLRSPLFGG